MKKIYMVMRPQDFRANRLLLICNSLAQCYDFNLVVLHDTEGEPCDSKPVETGWTLPFSERECVFDRLSSSGYALEVLKQIVGDDSGEDILMVFSCEQYLPLIKEAKKTLGMLTWYEQREMFIVGVGDALASEEEDRLRVWEEPFLEYIDLVTTVDSHEKWWEARYRGFGLETHVIDDVPPLTEGVLEYVREQIEERDISGVIDLVVVGGIRINQGLEPLIDALDMLPRRFRLNLMGLVNSNFKQRFEALLAMKSDRNFFVQYFQWMPYNAMLKQVSKYHIGLFLKQPGKGQYDLIARGNARKPFTYMNCGLPQVTPNHKSACLHVAEKGVGVRVDSTSPKEIADGIAHILADEKRYREMCYKGIKATEDEYNWDVEWGYLEATLNRVFKF